MDSFLDELKQAREAKNISLSEISASTLIDVKMLEAIERGNVKILPQTYIRAFLREYAGIVGLNPQDIMRKYDEWLKTNAGSPATTQGRPRKAQVTEPTQTPEPGSKKRFFDYHTLGPAFFKIAGALVVLILIEIVLWNFLQNEPTPAVDETPFKDVVREHEQKAGMADSTLPPAPAAVVTAPDDSLRLVATTTDSVWLQIIVDDKPLVQHFLLPNTSYSWRGRKSFRVPAVGNPVHLKLTLQGKRVRIPTKNKKVARDLLFSLDSIRR